MSNGTRCEGTFFLLVVQRFHGRTGRNGHRWCLLGLAPSAFFNTAVTPNHVWTRAWVGALLTGLLRSCGARGRKRVAARRHQGVI